MKSNWLWDRKLEISQVKKILRNPQDRKFILFASLLLARNNEPSEVFKECLKPEVFCKYWSFIKKRMRQDTWNQPRIVFWQAIYEKLIEKFREQGVSFRKGSPSVQDSICREVGRLIYSRRKELRLSQKELAEKMNISQQLISRVEKGKENISLFTFKNIAKALNSTITISLGEN